METLKRGRPRRFCDPCQVDVDREKARERMRQQRELGRSASHDLPDEDVYTLMHRLESEYFDISVGSEQKRDILRGANSPAGPSEGRSTYFEDLRAELDILSHHAANHPWFTDNPHWNYELHSPEKARVYLRLR